MALRIRLKRVGRRNRPFWRICATDGQAARDGRVVEELGHYDPLAKDEQKVTVNRERVCHWLKVGGQPSETVEQLLRHVGIDRKGNQIQPKPWRKRKAPPPPAAKRVAEEKAKAAEGAEAPVEAESSREAETPAQAETAPEAETPAQAETAPEAEAPAQAETAPEAKVLDEAPENAEVSTLPRQDQPAGTDASPTGAEPSEAKEEQPAE